MLSWPGLPALPGTSWSQMFSAGCVSPFHSRVHSFSSTRAQACLPHSVAGVQGSTQKPTEPLEAPACSHHIQSAKS